MRVYTSNGSARFRCMGFSEPDHLGHEIVFVWTAGCIHIDDHQPDSIGKHAILRGCDSGCTEYILFEGTDPQLAAHDIVEL